MSNNDTQRPAARVRDAWESYSTCEVHGQYETPRQQFFAQRPQCPTCFEDARAEEKRKERVQESGLQGRFVTATFDTFEAKTDKQKRVLASCREFPAGPSDQWRTIWLHGTVGTGKTHLLAAMALATIARRKTARVLTARELVRRIRDTWQRGTRETESQAIEDLAGCGLLAIDEIGVGFGTEGEVLHLLDVLDLRYRLQKPTAIATNLNTEQLRAVLGDRLFDRLAEKSTVRVCDWPSHRRST